MWPFGKKNDKSADSSEKAEQATDAAVDAAANQDQAASDSAADAVDSAAQAQGAGEKKELIELPYTAGPFDIEEANPAEFDFSNFAKASVNLGSVLLPVPHEGDIQVEMGPNGPTMLHVATAHGRVTPVAFAAPKSGGLWEQSAAEIKEGLESDGLTVHIEEGPWGSEVVGVTGDMVMRIIGADGPRWMLRMTAAGPTEHAEQLARVARGLLAHSFVSRGENPMPAGQPLPVTLPAAMAEEIRKAYQQQAQQAQQSQEQDGDNA